MVGKVVWVSAMGELSEEVLDSLLHLTTSPIPVLMRTDPDLAAGGAQWSCVPRPSFPKNAHHHSMCSTIGSHKGEELRIGCL